MGGLNPFKKAPKQDTSALDAQQKKLDEQDAKIEVDEKKRLEKDKASKRARKGRSSRQSLLVGLETGVAPTDEKRASLG